MSAEPESHLSRVVKFRQMTLADIARVMEIERDSYPFPWSDGIFRDCVRVGYYCRVVEFRGVVYGYVVMSYGAGEAHILNICIASDLREQGVGRRLLAFVIEQARKMGMEDMFLEVRPSNPPAIHLYESIGFARVGIRKGYYQASPGREDAWVYKLGLKSIDTHC